jgi:hypothetical protein
VAYFSQIEDQSFTTTGHYITGLLLVAVTNALKFTNSPDHPIYQLHLIVLSYKGQKICHGTTRPCLKPVQFSSELANLLCIDEDD